MTSIAIKETPVCSEEERNVDVVPLHAQAPAEKPAYDPADKLCAEALATITEMLTLTSGNVETSANELSRRFRTLADGASAQSSKIKGLAENAATLDYNDEIIDLRDFSDLFRDTLDSSISRIVDVAKTSMGLVFSMSEAFENMETLKNSVTGIKKINKKTNILALNAIIEATRAGEAGRGFSVVANEVRILSQEINALSDEIQDKIRRVGRDIAESHKLLRTIASMDMTDQVLAKERLHGLMNAMIRRQNNFSDVLSHSAEEARRISESIVGLTVNMQFQDRTSQYIDNANSILAVVRDYLIHAPGAHSAELPDEKTVKELHDRITEVCRLSEFKQNFIARAGGEEPVSEQSGNEDDDIELF